jgi:hypothetical protein
MLWITLLIPFIFSCERELEYDLRSAQPRLVVNSIIGQDSLFQIEVSTTAQPGEGNSIVSLTDARISLTEEGLAITDFVLDSAKTLPAYMNEGDRPVERTLYFLRSAYSKVRAGRDYHITVSYQGYETAEATAKIPRAARVEYHPERGSTNLMLDGRDLMEVRFSIIDDGLPHFYGIELVTENDAGSRKNIEFYSFETAFNANLANSGNVSGEGVWYNTREGVFFPNNQFQGSAKEFSVYLDSEHLSGKDLLNLRIVSMSSDFYNFAVSYKQQRQNSGNPFAEPVVVHSNIQHGAGIFAGYAVTEVELH